MTVVLAEIVHCLALKFPLVSSLHLKINISPLFGPEVASVLWDVYRMALKYRIRALTLH